MKWNERLMIEMRNRWCPPRRAPINRWPPCGAHLFTHGKNIKGTVHIGTFQWVHLLCSPIWRREVTSINWLLDRCNCLDVNEEGVSGLTIEESDSEVRSPICNHKAFIDLELHYTVVFTSTVPDPCQYRYASSVEMSFENILIRVDILRLWLSLVMYKYLIRIERRFQPIQMVKTVSIFLADRFDYSLSFQKINRINSVLILELG